MSGPDSPRDSNGTAGTDRPAGPDRTRAADESARPASTSRRAFLKTAGVAAVSGLAVGGAAGGVIGAQLAGGAGHTDGSAAETDFTPLAPRSEPGFDHVVVLMFENRSFDNLLGWLYQDGGLAPGQKFEGLQRGVHSNVAPDGTRIDAHVYEGSTDEVMSSPSPDPGEFYPHVNTQLFNVIDPPGNAQIWKNGLAPPFNLPEVVGVPAMSGFVSDYIVNFREVAEGREPSLEEYSKAMGGFSPEMLPVLSTLARGFGVYDHWFASVPSQTFCNRSFLHAGTSHGFVTNREGGGYGKWLDASYTATIFNRLEEAGVSWRVYYDEQQLVSLTGMLHAPALQKYWKSRFRGMAQFHRDAADGTLPAYSFVEPRMIFNHNDMHPPYGRLRESVIDGDEVFDSALSDVRAGEALLASVYDAIKNASSASGSNAINTALVVTFDEHGGTYDHVPPPTVVSPGEEAEPGEMGFAFDRLGCRVPAIVISAYTWAGTVINDQMEHGSVAATLGRLHGLAPLSRRDASANDILGAVNLDKPRQPALWPDVHPAYVPPNPEAVPAPQVQFTGRPLSSPAEGLLGLLLAKYEPDAPIPRNYGDAYDVLVKHGQGLFGVRD